MLNVLHLHLTWEMIETFCQYIVITVHWINMKFLDRQFVRNTAVTTVGQKSEGKPCPGKRGNGRRCRGKLHDNVLDWEDGLPDADLDLAISHAWWVMWRGIHDVLYGTISLKFIHLYPVSDSRIKKDVKCRDKLIQII